MNTTPGQLQLDITKAMGLTLHKVEKQGKSLDELCGTISKLAQSRDLPYDCYTAACGICYARQAGRMTGKSEMAVRDLKGNEATALIAQVACQCKTIGEVPPFIFELFG